GPTTGDRIRLGDTGLFVEIERDLRGGYSDEIVFGGGKSMREGMGMDNRVTRAGGAPDLVITNVTIIDAVLGIVKADVGIKDGRICAIGKAGNPQTMDRVTPGLEVGLAWRPTLTTSAQRSAVLSSRTKASRSFVPIG